MLRRVFLRRLGPLFGLALAAPGPAAEDPAPGRELRLPFFPVFDPHDYRGHSQVWGVMEDTARLVYSGNYGSVLVYNGTRWDRITAQNQTPPQRVSHSGW